MGITEIKAKKILGGPGSFAWIAEAEVEADGKKVYVTVSYYDGEEYTVSENGLYEFLAGAEEEPCTEFLEEYTDWDEAQGSKYVKVYEVLRGVIDEME